jgi:hypothetical protein
MSSSGSFWEELDAKFFSLREAQGEEGPGQETA